MSTTTLNKRLDRLHGAISDWREGIASRLEQAKVIHAAKREEYRQQGLTDAEISSRENDELGERLAAMPDSSFKKRLHGAHGRLARFRDYLEGQHHAKD